MFGGSGALNTASFGTETVFPTDSFLGKMLNTSAPRDALMGVENIMPLMVESSAHRQKACSINLRFESVSCSGTLIHLA